MKEFIEAIYPGFTYYAVLITVAGGAFRFARFLNKYEKETKEECFERLCDLLKNFRRKYIEPILVDYFSAFYKAACLKGFRAFISDLYQTELIDGRPTENLVGYQKLKSILSKTSLKNKENWLMENPNKEIEEFLFTASGENLFTRMDELYKKVSFLQFIFCYKKKLHSSLVFVFVSFRFAFSSYI